MKKKLKNIFIKIYSEMEKVVGRDIFIPLVAVFVLFSSFFGYDLICYFVIALTLCFIFCSNAEPRASLPFFLMLVYAVSAQNSPYEHRSEFYIVNMPFLMAMAALVLACIVFGLIKRRMRPKLTLSFFGVLALCISFFMGGIGSGYNILNIPAAAILTSYFLGLFCLFSAFIKKSDFEYVAKCVVVASMVVSAQVIWIYIKDISIWNDFDKGKIILGWGVSNSIAIMIVTGVPLTCYLMTKSKCPELYFLILAYQFFTTLFTFSRGAMLVVIPTTFLGIVYAFIRVPNKYRIRLAVCIVLFLVGLVLFIKSQWDYFEKALQFYVESGFDGRGREELYDEAYEVFKNHIAFGAGVTYKLYDMFFILYFVHNTVLQFMMWSGLIGLFAGIFHVAGLFYIGFKNPSEQKLFLYASALVIFMHSLLDIVIFMPSLTAYYMLFIALAEAKDPKKGKMLSSYDFIFCKNAFKKPKSVKNINV